MDAIPKVLFVGSDEGAYRETRGALAALYGNDRKLDRVRSWPEGLDAVRSATHDLYLVDDKIDGRSGLDIVREMAAEGWGPFVLLFDPDGDRARLEAAANAIDSAHVDYLTKGRIRRRVLRRVVRYARLRKRAEEGFRQRQEAMWRHNLELQDVQSRLEEQGAASVALADDLALARQGAEAALRKAEESERRYRTLSENSPVGIWQITPDGDTAYVNPIMGDFLRMIGFDTPTGCAFEIFFAAESLAAVAEARAQWMRGMTASCEVAMAGKGSGSVRRHAVISGSPLVSADGEVESIILTALDITERKIVEEAMRKMARHDPLTGLPNRAMFQERLRRALAATRRDDTLAGVLLIDLDHFKDVNDTFGHPVGDRLLQMVAERLGGCVRETDTVARLGGDEFAIIATHLEQGDDAAVVARSVIKNLSEHLQVDGMELSVGASVGITLFPVDGAEPDQLLTNADLALYKAKAEGRSRYHFYDSELNKAVKRRNALKSDLARALAREEFVLHYQPLIDTDGGALAGVEALLRWNHPTRGMVSPSEFIPIAEATGLIVPIGEWILRAACAQSMAWTRAGLPQIPVAVNLSAVQLKRADLVDMVNWALEETDLDPAFLELEITESTIMDNVEAVGVLLGRLTDLGLRLAIDDFGTGYSSLAYLKRFPVSKIKLDGSFVRDLGTDKDAAAIVGACVSLGRALGLRVVAEGVETESQLAFLRELGCREVQGYHFSRPLEPDRFVEWYRDYYRAPPGTAAVAGGRPAA